MSAEWRSRHPTTGGRSSVRAHLIESVARTLSPLRHSVPMSNFTFAARVAHQRRSRASWGKGRMAEIPERAFSDASKLARKIGSRCILDDGFFDTTRCAAYIEPILIGRDTNLSAAEARIRELEQERANHFQTLGDLTAQHSIEWHAENKRASHLHSRLQAVTKLYDGSQDHVEQLAHLQARNQELEKALRHHGVHSPGCSRWSRPNRSSGQPCSCGLDAALAHKPSPEENS